MVTPIDLVKNSTSVQYVSSDDSYITLEKSDVAFGNLSGTAISGDNVHMALSHKPVHSTAESSMEVQLTRLKTALTNCTAAANFEKAKEAFRSLEFLQPSLDNSVEQQRGLVKADVPPPAAQSQSSRRWATRHG